MLQQRDACRALAALPASELHHHIGDRLAGQLPVRGHQEQWGVHRSPADALHAEDVLAKAADRAGEDDSAISGRLLGHPGTISDCEGTEQEHRQLPALGMP